MGGVWTRSAARRIGRRLVLPALCVGLVGGIGMSLAEPPFGYAPHPATHSGLPPLPPPSAPPPAPAPFAAPSFAGGGAPRIAGSWLVLPLPEAPLAGEIVFYDRQFEGRAGCGRLFGSYDRMDPWFRVRDPHLEGRCELEAELLERLTRAGRLTKRGAVLEFSDASGRVLLRLSPR